MEDSRVRRVAYWVITVGLAWELGFGAFSDLARLGYVRAIVTQLGYPLYLLTIIGIWKALAAIVLLVPRRPILKEWAYAGCFFVLTGAAASHLAAGSRFLDWFGPLVGSGFTVASWALRSPSRRAPSSRARL